MASGGSILGNAVRRVEDPGILTGATRYTDDLVVEGALHLVFVRSTVAHARIDAIAVDEAKAMPGVVDVVTAADLALPLHHGMPLIDPKFNRPPLADGVVRFVGEPVVAVVAETAAQAVDAAEAVIVDYDDLDVVVDPEAALAPGAPVLFPEAGTNVCNDLPSGRDADVHADADLVVESRFVNQRVAAAPLEVNGCIAAPDPDSGGVVVWLPSQGPHGMQHQLAAALGLERDQVRVVSPAVGGGFGAKQGVCVEFLVVARAHQRLGRPVRWVETRSENMVAMRQGRAQVQQLRLGVKRDGTFTSLSGTIYQDAGAYPEVGAFLPFFTRNMASGVYVIPEIAIDIKSVVTNTTPVGAYRGAGRPEATSMVERIVDLAAVELGMDPAEIRRRNLVAPDAFPYTTATGATYDVGDYGRALDEALRLADYDGLRREQQERRDQDAAPWLGIGLSAYVEVTGPISLTD